MFDVVRVIWKKMGRTMKMFERTHAFHSSKGRSKGVRICLSLATAIFITCCFTSLAPAVSISVNQSSIVFPDTLVGSSSSVETFTATVQDLGPLSISGWSASVVSPTDFNFLGFGLGCVTGLQNPCTRTSHSPLSLLVYTTSHSV